MGVWAMCLCVAHTHAVKANKLSVSEYMFVSLGHRLEQVNNAYHPKFHKPILEAQLENPGMDFSGPREDELHS
jgi:hypothetical protein